MIRPVTAVTAFILAACSATAYAQSGSEAESTGPFSKKHLLSVGMTRQATSTSVSATSGNFDPVVIDLSDVGLSERDYSYFVDYRYRLKPNWSIFTGTFQFSSSGGSVSERDFNFDGVEFTAGLDLRSELDIDVYILDILYTVHRSDSFELMLGGGLHAFDLGVAFTGSVSINEESSEVRAASSTLLAPVPNFRGAATWTITQNFGFSLVAGWLSADIDDYSGDFMYGHLRANYQFNDRFGASLGYQITDVDITESRARGDLSFDTELDGASLTLTYGF